MSDNVVSFGTMVPLTEKIDVEKWEEIEYDLYNKHRVQINYEGTLAYTDLEDMTKYGLNLVPDSSITMIERALREYNIEVNVDLARNYICMWYNGADSDMAVMELNYFMEMRNE